MLNVEFQNPSGLWFLFFLIPVFLIYFWKSQPKRIIVTTNIFWIEVLNNNNNSNFSVRRAFYFLSLASSLLFVLLIVAAIVDPVCLPTDKDENLNRRLGKMSNANAEIKENNADSKLSNQILKPKVNYSPFAQDVEKTCRNIAITRFQSRLSFADLSRYELFVEVHNFDDKTAETKLKISVDNKISDIIPVLLNPHETKSYSINGEIIHPQIIVTKITDDNKSYNADSEKVGGVVIRGKLEIKDSFENDNVAYSILSSPKLQKILYYGEDNFFLESALKSYLSQLHGQVNFERIKSIPKIVSSDSVLVINRQTPPKLPIGNLMIFDPRNSCDLFDIGELLLPPTVIDTTSKNSSLTRFTQLDGVEISGAREFDLNKSKENKTPTILLSTVENYPIYLSWNFRNKNTFNKPENLEINKINNIVDTSNEIDEFGLTSRILVFDADISRSDLVLRTAFPILISNALNYFSGVDNEPEQNYNVGDSVILRTEIMSDWVEIKSPNGKRIILPAHKESDSTTATIYINELTEIGVYEIFESNVNDIKFHKDKINHSRLIKRLACNCQIQSNKTLEKSLEKISNNSIKQISTKEKQYFFDFNKVSFYFLFTITALILLIVDWCIARL